MAKHDFTTAIAIMIPLALGACVVTPEGRALQSSEAQYKACLTAGGTCEREQRMFEADKAFYDSLTARGTSRGGGPTNCIYGNGLISCN
jgi:hypothetical protein